MTTNTNAALREKLIDMIAEHLSGTYRCLRVWEAWNFGTMSQDDFDDVGESDTPPELADAILAALSTAAQPPAADLAGDGDSTKDEIRMKQYPELPTHFMLVQESFRDEVYLYTADQMRAYADSWLQAYIQRKAESPTQPAAPESQDAEDAARYRYLKKYKALDSTDVFYWLRCAPADEVDSIIDAARSAQGESIGD